MLGGAVIGFFCLRRRGIYFAMLTLAFAQLLYFIAFHLADVTGGDDGLRGIPQLPLNLFGWTIQARRHAGLLLLRLRAGRAGGGRAQADPRLALRRRARRPSARTATAPPPAATTSTASGTCRSSSRRCSPASRAALDALRLAVVPVESLYWTTSGQVVIMTLLGGAGHVLRSLRRRRHLPRPRGPAEPSSPSRWPLVIGAHLHGVRALPAQGSLGHAGRTPVRHTPRAGGPAPAAAPSPARRT